jgi:quercetin dioxygenase-like cupin family protein
VDGQGTEAVKTSDASRIVTTKVTVQPGAQIPWHTHHGPVFVTIVQGELTYVSSEDCVGRRYALESAFLDPGHGHVHTAYNSGTTVTQFLATFFEVPKDGPISIPAEGPADCKIPTS